MFHEYVKEFDEWNSFKKDVQSADNVRDYFPQEGEVWMASVGVNIGREQDGIGMSFSRPMLVVKKFNNEIFWCVPLSTKQKNLDFYYNFTDPNDLQVAAVLAQMKLVSVKRLQRNLYTIDPPKLVEIKEKLRGFLR